MLSSDADDDPPRSRFSKTCEALFALKGPVRLVEAALHAGEVGIGPEGISPRSSSHTLPLPVPRSQRFPRTIDSAWRRPTRCPFQWRARGKGPVNHDWLRLTVDVRKSCRAAETVNVMAGTVATAYRGLASVLRNRLGEPKLQVVPVSR